MAIISENRGEASADTQTPYTLSLGDVFQGTLALPDDQDWLRLNLSAGTIYNITLTGVEFVSLALLDGAGERITDSYSGTILYQPAVSGEYYLSISDASDASVDYEVSLAENTLPEGTHDEIADYLTDGFQIWFGDTRQAFDVAPGGTLSANITALTEAGQQLARWALEAWTYASGIRFKFVEHEDAHITFDDTEEGAAAFTTASNGIIISSYVNVSAELLLDDASPGSEAFFIYIHEIGHALGLGHAGPYNDFGGYGVDNAFLNDSVQVTVMSYFFQDQNTYIDASVAFPVTPMIADIIAIHNLYGAPTDIHAGDTVYGYRSNVDGYLGQVFELWTGAPADPEFSVQPPGPAALTLYDNGGNDTLDLRTDPDDQRIDLRPGGISDVYGLTGNLVIARDTVIENVIAGSGDDVVIGNVGDNYLEGRAGADDLRGGAGEDTLEGGGGADRLDGGAGMDWVSYRGSDAAVTVNLVDNTVTGGHAEGDTISGIENAIGSDYADQLTGNDGANRMEGGGGADRLDGGAGEDWLSYRGSNAGVRVNLGDNTVSGGHAEGDAIVNFENLTGSGHDDVLTGDAGANQLDGGQGDDVLDGGAGGDRLAGGAGEDIATYEHSAAAVTVRLHTLKAQGGHAQGDSFAALVTVEYSNGNGEVRRETVPDIERLRGSAHDDILAGDSRDNRLYGGPGNDRLYGGPGGGADLLMGGDGADALFGGIGDDVLEGGAAADLLKGGVGSDTVSYRHSSAGVEVRLHSGMARAGDAEGDVLDSIENVRGSAHADILDGDADANVLEGGGGADRLDGGGGTDWLAYLTSDSAVRVNLGDETAAGGHAEGDVFTGFENVAGSGYRDLLAGDDGANTLFGHAGEDELRGGGGDDVLQGGADADRLDGGPGNDTATYRASDLGVRANLNGEASEGGHAQGDVLSDIENLSGSAYRDVLAGNATANRLDGNGGDDELRGGGGSDRLAGDSGHDWLYGGAGDDALHGGAGDDRLFGEDGMDTLYGDAGDDTLHGGHDNDELFGGVGDDRLHGNAGGDALRGGAGADLLSGDAGADRLDGGGGIDWVSYLGSATGVTVNLAAGTGEGGDAEGDVISAVENLAGSDHRDVLRGDGAANTLHGLGGADELHGNAGDDVLEGGPGADLLQGGPGVDEARYQSSDAGVTVSLLSGDAGRGHADGDTVFDIENVTGSDYGDILEGDDAANRLAGGKGDDILLGNGGADRLDGGAGADTIDYSASDAGVIVNLELGTGFGGHAEGDVIIHVESVTGSDYPDILTGDAQGNVLQGHDGDDELYGGAGYDQLNGGAGADRLDGGGGYDEVTFHLSDAGVRVNLGTGEAQGGHAQGDVITGVESVLGSRFTDVLTGDDNHNALEGIEGNDELTGGGGNDFLDGGEGDDDLHGNAGDDLLEGFSGDDELYGGAGDDWLVGDTGADRLDGGAGDDELTGHAEGLADGEDSDGSVDVFVFAAGHGDDIIHDFADAEDKIDLSAFNLSGFADLSLSSTDYTPGGTIIDLSEHGGGTVLLAGFDIANLDASDFLF